MVIIKNPNLTENLFFTIFTRKLNFFVSNCEKLKSLNNQNQILRSFQKFQDLQYFPETQNLQNCFN